MPLYCGREQIQSYSEGRRGGERRQECEPLATSSHKEEKLARRLLMATLVECIPALMGLPHAHHIPMPITFPVLDAIEAVQPDTKLALGPSVV